MVCASYVGAPGRGAMMARHRERPNVDALLERKPSDLPTTERGLWHALSTLKALTGSIAGGNHRVRAVAHSGLDDAERELGERGILLVVGQPDV